MAVALVGNGRDRLSTGGTSHTVSFDVGAVGSNGLLVVKLRPQDGGTTLSNVAFNGVALTSAGAAVGDSTAWYLAAPATGTHDLTLTTDNWTYIFYDWASWSGADQTTPVGTQVGVSSSAAGTRSSGSVTCPTNGVVWASLRDEYSEATATMADGTAIGTPYYTGSSVVIASGYRTSTGAIAWDDSNYAYTWEVIALPISEAVTLPVVTVQPTEQTAADGGTATFSATVTGATSYQWERKAPGGGSWANVSGGSGATTDSYTTGTLSRSSDAGALYRLKASNANGDTYSNEVLLWVTQIPTSYASSVGLVHGSSLSFVGASYTGVSNAKSTPKVWNGSAWVEKPVKVYDGAAWKAKPVRVNTGAWS